ncbi:DUF309 domain-containing protein [Brevibacillus composti]|uniref:DUF309 domain-containing protein n=1 Tax=Brevibacillus composti TaxID=2796470 RepID=A0A7T5JQ54_9BACL|nr:DUF309 domain-containing protein [Brevibacillus composti]QQE75989.1 DUF309 domain-containing protein [Brevibacillus composti]QUO43015.1 DUF309 domain-containing protein [Brevibacillus composti]
MYPEAYVEYLVQFHAERDYFECHEILEEYWKESPPGERQAVWVALIQIAVSLYHQRRGNFAGALKMMRSAIAGIMREKAAVKALGLDVDSLLAMLRLAAAQQEARQPYRSISLPIADPALLEACRTICADRGLSFDRESDLQNEFLLHKHTLRDRSDVVEERERQLRRRSQPRDRSTGSDT